MKKHALCLLVPAFLVACSQPQLPSTEVRSSPTAIAAAELSSPPGLEAASPASQSAAATPTPEPASASTPETFPLSQYSPETFTRTAAVSPTEVPISLIAFAPAIQAGEARSVLIVPDRDTTKSAYGGKLRRYDVHLAKMFEVPNLYCNPSNGNWHSVEWNYFAGDGEINMGKFRLDCHLVRQVVAENRLGKPERTEIYYYGPTGKKSVEQVPILEITGDKIDNFLEFVQTIQQTGKAERIEQE